MKKLIFVLSLGLMIGMVNINKAEAQVHVSINIDLQPAWGPSGYNYAEFYYIPEINIYYDVVNRLFYYPNRGRWIPSVYLPVAYSYYDFYSLYKVVLNGMYRPWEYNRRHVNMYSPYRYNYVQVPIYYMKEHRYRHARDNYHGWVEPRYMPKNNGRPHSREISMNTRNGRINNEMRSANNTNNRRDAVSNRSSSSRNEATMNGRNNNNNNNNNNKNNSRIGAKEYDRNNVGSRSGSTNNNKQSSSVAGSRSSSARSGVAADNNNSSVNRSKSNGNNSRSSENKSSRSTKENKSERSGSSRSDKR